MTTPEKHPITPSPELRCQWQSDWEKPFIPEDTLKIDSNGGNIGRFYWSNQVTFSIEQWGHNNFYEATVYELPGVSVFLWSEFDRVGWLMGGFEPLPKTNSRPTHYSN